MPLNNRKGISDQYCNHLSQVMKETGIEHDLPNFKGFSAYITIDSEGFLDRLKRFFGFIPEPIRLDF